MIEYIGGCMDGFQVEDFCAGSLIIHHKSGLDGKIYLYRYMNTVNGIRRFVLEN